MHKGDIVEITHERGKFVAYYQHTETLHGKVWYIVSPFDDTDKPRNHWIDDTARIRLIHAAN